MLRSIPCLANMFILCKKQLSWQNCASLVQLGVKWPVSVLEMGVVFSMCLYVLVCVVFVVLLVASVLASMCWLLCGGTVQKKKTRSVTAKKSDRIYRHYGLN